MSVANSYDDYKDEIEIIKEQNRVECDLYSIIASILRECKNGINISLRDVSVRRGTKFSKVFRGNAGFPDFVVRDREKSNSAKILGAVEIKYLTIDLDDEDNLEQLSGHISFYKKVLYTNGFVWRFYNPEMEWEITLGRIENNIITWEWDKNKWEKLIENLNKIEWETK